MQTQHRAGTVRTPTPAELSSLMRAFRATHGLNVLSAGEWLGLSARTVEGIEQGRGHSAPRLLALALLTLSRQKKLSDPVDTIR